MSSERLRAAAWAFVGFVGCGGRPAPGPDAALADLLAASEPSDPVDPVDGGGLDGGLCVRCSAWARAPSPGNIEAPELLELSGIAASWRHAGVWYAHNDSGDSARFFAMTGAGEARGEFTVAGADALDWEDVAVGPCAAGSCVFLGDIGDNDLVRSEICVYRVAETDLAPAMPAPRASVPGERFCFVYPDGAHNCEALLVHPQSGRLYFVSKDDSGAPPVYRAPAVLNATGTNLLEAVGPLTLPAVGSTLVTAGDVHPCGDRMLLRTYSHLWTYSVPAGAPFEGIFSATPTLVPVSVEPQGEAVGYQRDGRGFLTASESSARPLPLHAGVCP